MVTEPFLSSLGSAILTLCKRKWNREDMCVCVRVYTQINRLFFSRFLVRKKVEVVAVGGNVCIPGFVLWIETNFPVPNASVWWHRCRLATVTPAQSQIAPSQLPMSLPNCSTSIIVSPTGLHYTVVLSYDILSILTANASGYSHTWSWIIFSA